MSENYYPYIPFRFKLEIDEITMASFSEVTGIGAEFEPEEIKEGGVNDFTLKLPKTIKYANLVLKRGVTEDTEIYDWFAEAMEGKIKVHHVGVVLLDSKGEEAKRWRFENAYPVKWQASDLNSQGNSVMIETLELAHHGFRFIK